MANIQKFKSTVSAFAADRGGNFAMMFAAASTVTLMATGVAVDYSRMLSAKTQMRAALDGAILSTAKAISTGKIKASDAQTEITDFFISNLSAKRFDFSKTKITDFAINPVDFTISANAETDLEMMFPVFGTGKYQMVKTKSTALYTERKVEVSMVLDVTGSMAGSKLNELKAAAKVGVDEFLNNGAKNARVAIVPYAFGVNAGGLKPTVRNEAGLPAADACATERRGPARFTDASPASNKGTRANQIRYWEMSGGVLDYRKNGYFFDLPKDTNVGGKWGADCPTAAMQPLTDNIGVLNGLIDSLQASGGTAGQIGLEWGWFMLSPNWKSAFPAKSKPVNYNTPNVEKFVILMTDGLFNSEASGLDNADIPNFAGVTQPSGRLALQYCQNVKAKNVKIFTIGFRLNDIGNAGEQTEAIKMLTDCASTPDAGQQTFYNAEDGAQLKAAFKEIAKHTEVVALTN